MNKIITTKSIFTDSRFEISLSDSILEDGLVLEVINMEEPKQNIRLELTWKDFDTFKELVNSIEKPVDVAKLIREMNATPVTMWKSSNTKNIERIYHPALIYEMLGYVSSCDPWEKEENNSDSEIK